jgi:iron-sulfur cluster insertion protein
MATPASEVMTPITLSAAAVAQIKPLIEQELTKEDNKAESLALRVYIAGASCSGFRYGMALDGTTNSDDQVFEQDGVRIVVDEESLNHIVGSTIDFVDGPMGKGFAVNNPNVQAGCSSCGHSCGDHGETEE